MPLIRDALRALGIARLGAPGFEADDVIGTLTARHRGVMPVDVVTGDRDLLQLVDDTHGIRVLYTGKGGVRDPDIATQSYLHERYAVPTGEAYLDMSVLRGDTSDGLPGVKGIGDKTAAQLIAAYGTLAGLRAPCPRCDPTAEQPLLQEARFLVRHDLPRAVELLDLLLVSLPRALLADGCFRSDHGTRFRQTVADNRGDRVPNAICLGRATGQVVVHRHDLIQRPHTVVKDRQVQFPFGHGGR